MSNDVLAKVSRKTVSSALKDEHFNQKIDAARDFLQALFPEESILLKISIPDTPNKVVTISSILEGKPIK
jgi:hypothetical protein